MRRIVWWLGIVALWQAASPVLAQSRASGSGQMAVSQTGDNVAQALFEAGQSAYSAGNYEEALQFFEQSYDRYPRSDLLYNIGESADRLRQDHKTLAAFKAYLDQVPNAANRAEVEQRVAALEAVQQKRDATISAPSAAALSPEAAARSDDPDAERNRNALADSGDDDKEPVTKKWWFWTAIGGGVVVTATVVILAVALSGSDPSQAPQFEGSAPALRGP